MTQPTPSLDDEVLAVLRWVLDGPVPEEVLERSRELLLDTIGCAIAGTAEPEVRSLFWESSILDAGPIRFPGVAEGLSGSAFARCFAAAACWHEACEGLAEAHGRPGLHALPAALGLALSSQAPLSTVLHALAAGYEVGGRMGVLCRIRPGMHVDGTWGSFGAAVALAHMTLVPAEQVLAAVQHAACHMPFSLYWPIAAGSTARNVYPGHGAVHGAASLAAAMAGMGGPPGSIAEMLRRMLGIEVPAAMPGVGRWLLAEGYLKPYPAVRHVHYGAAAAEAWRGDPASIEAVTLHTYPEAMTYCGNRAPATAIQAQFSLSYGVAHMLVHGTLDPLAYGAARLGDPSVRRVEAMMAVQADAGLAESGRRGAVLEVVAGGEVWRRRVDAIPGDAGLPMSRTQVLDKFVAYAAPVIGQGHADAVAFRILEGPPSMPFHLGP